MELELKLEKYEGPLALLLHLIEKNKVSITDIPIAQITDQYITYIDAMSSEKMEVMSEFVEMAATLLAIKAKMLLPRPKQAEAEEIDPRQELMEQLLEYKKYKAISEKLREYSQSAAKNVFKPPTIPEELLNYTPPVDPETILANLDFERLYRAFQVVMKRREDKIDPIRAGFSEISREAVSLEDKMQAIRSLRGQGQVSFFELLAQEPSRPTMIVSFLAILELMKAGEIRVEQGRLFEDIIILFCPEQE